MTLSALTGADGPCVFQSGRYERALVAACENSPPVFGTAHYGDLFRQLASEPSWLALSLIANARMESEGSQRLWALASCTNENLVSEQIREHSRDEARHASWYLSVLELVFPHALPPEHIRMLRDEVAFVGGTIEDHHIRDSSYAREASADDLIQMNIAEIRTSIHQMLQTPVLRAYCPKTNVRKLDHLLDRLLNDEISHIKYTGRLIDSYAEGRMEEIVQLMSLRLRDFNAITAEEIGQGSFG